MDVYLNCVYYIAVAKYESVSSMFRAGVAHLVERNLAKVQVVGSRPITRSKRIRCN